jgi:hypothetical protein
MRTLEKVVALSSSVTATAAHTADSRSAMPLTGNVGPIATARPAGTCRADRAMSDARQLPESCNGHFRDADVLVGTEGNMGDGVKRESTLSPPRSETRARIEA